MIDIPLLMMENDSPVFYFTSAYSALGDVYKLVTRSITRRTLLAPFWCTDGDMYGNDGAATLPEIAAPCAVLSFTPFYISIRPSYLGGVRFWSSTLRTSRRHRIPSIFEYSGIERGSGLRLLVRSLGARHLDHGGRVVYAVYRSKV